MKTRKGFTLIELMIVIAIIAIIAAIAIPNLMASRVRANEATAISALKQIATAQVTFQAGRQGRRVENTDGGASGFCSNFRILAFGLPVGDDTGKLALISDAVANAYVADATYSPAASGNNALDTPAPYQGYEFHDDPAVTASTGGWGTDFSHYGVPVNGGTTGNNIYWLGQAGTVFLKGVIKDTEVTAQDSNPEEDAAEWATL